MAELKNCVSTTINPDGTTTESCIPCQSIKMTDSKNKVEGCDPISVKCASIENAVCLPILADQIFDSIYVEKEDLGSLSNLTFNLDNFSSNYVAGQPVCIQKIGIGYDFIGLEQTVAVNSEVVVAGQTFTLNPTSLYDASTVAGTPVYLFDELGGTIGLQLPCYCDNPTTQGVKLRISEKNRGFQVANLKILVSGLVGSNAFTATADTKALFTPNTNLIPLSIFGISNMTFNGKICWPYDKNRMTLNHNYGTKLAVDSINPTSNYTASAVQGTPGSFTASVDLSFAADIRAYVSNRAAMAVFTTPNATILKNGEVIE